MKFFLRTSAREAGFDELAPDRGVAVPLEGPVDGAVGVICDENPLSMEVEAAARCLLLSEPTPGKRLIAWSGSVAELMFERDVRSWMPESRSAFEAMCDALAPVLESSGRRLVFRPCSRHVLSDAHACRAFLEGHRERPIGVLLDPIGMLEPEMLEEIDDHLDRSFEMLGPLCEGVALTGGRVEADRIVPASLGEGLPLVDALIGRLLEHCPPETSVLLLEGATERALADLAARA